MNIAFKHPEFLYFLFAICIPIIIHLFSFRKYKKVFFHNIHLLKNIQQQQNRTRSKLKELLVLACRILTIAAISIAFAQPFIPNNTTYNKAFTHPAIAIYIDNSFSSQSESQQGIILDVAKTQALKIINEYSAQQDFYLLTNNPHHLDNQSLSKQQITEAIHTIQVSPFSKKISEISQGLQTLKMQTNRPIRAYAFSDFQKYSSDFEQIVADSLIAYVFVAIENQLAKNIRIDTCYFETPYRMHKQAEKLLVQLTNNSDETYSNMAVKLYIRDSLRAISNVTIQPHSSTTTGMEFSIHSPGLVSGRVEIDDYPILYDNSLNFSYTIADKIPLLHIFNTKANAYIQALFAGNEYISVSQQAITSLDYASIQAYSTIIIDNLQTIPSGLSTILQNQIALGKTVICIPHESIDIDSYNSFLRQLSTQQIVGIDTNKQQVQTVDYKHAIYKQVFKTNDATVELPIVKKHYSLQQSSINTIISLKNKQALVTEIPYQAGRLFFITSPLGIQHGTFVSHPLFVGLYNMAFLVSSSSPLYTYIGMPSIVAKPETLGNQMFSIVHPQKQIDFIPQIMQLQHGSYVALHPHDAIVEAGNYGVLLDKKEIASVSYNYTRNESEMKFYSSSEIQAILDQLQVPNTSTFTSKHEMIAEKLAEIKNGKELWRLFILIALVCIALEIFFIRFLP